MTSTPLHRSPGPATGQQHELVIRDDQKGLDGRSRWTAECVACDWIGEGHWFRWANARQDFAVMHAQYIAQGESYDAGRPDWDSTS